MSLAPPKPSPLAPGYRLDRYELLCPIAQGGMASVWVARLRGKHGFEKLVAVKTILPEFASDARFQRMFLDEARIASGIEHANVAQIRDLGDERGVLYLVMEWVDGDSLSKLHRAAERRGELLPPGVAMRVLADACGGLHAAHELRDKSGALLGVVHRDVSPQNILVGVNGIAKVIDFGIAKARDRVAGETSTGALKGKVQYMAPEQALGRAVDRRADVWAVGGVLYYLLCGSPPYDADNQLATLHLLTKGEPPKPLPSHIHPSIAAVVGKAIAGDADARYATAAELQRALEIAMVEAGCPTSVGEVAACAELLASDRAAARRKAVELALDAAAERARMERLLVPAPDSSSGIGDAVGRVKEKMQEISDFGIDPRPSAQTTLADGPPAPGDGRDGRPRDLQRLAALPLSEKSSATLGSAVVETPARANATWWKIAAVGAAAVALLALGALLGPRAGSRATPAATETTVATAGAEPVVPPGVRTSDSVTPPSPPTSPGAVDVSGSVDAGPAASTRPSPSAAPRHPRGVSAPPTPAPTGRKKDYGF